MKNCILGIVLLMCAASASRALSADDTTKTPNFFVAAVRTEVHRSFVPEGVNAYAVVNCNALDGETKLKPAAWGEVEFATQLKRMASSGHSQLMLAMHYRTSSQISDLANDAIRVKLDEIARSSGCQIVDVSETATMSAWKAVYDNVRDFEEEEDARERIVEDELVRAYPLRTKLSKFVLGNADCVVEVKKRVGQGTQEISQPLQASIRRAIESMNLGPQKGVLQYQVSCDGTGIEAARTLFTDRGPVPGQNITAGKRSQGMVIAMELGFDDITCMLIASSGKSGTDGAPERLVAKPAPNFTLDTLDGEELELRSFIKGRPALVTFWGVACAPCRLESPQLTRMHEKYGSELAIVAVNGYNESREVVAEYAEKTQLRHTIVLNGRSVAKDLYRVGGYPTSFWIDREGIVQDYEVGFDNSAALERRIRAMLDAD